MITNETVNRAIGYILRHVGETLSVDDVAGHCCFSKCHFSRLFKAATGESVHEFIKRLKLEQSAFRLKAEKNRTVTDIGADYGYSASNYSTAFRQHHNLSPAQFRRNMGQVSAVNPIFRAEITLESFTECDKKITIEQLDDCRVIFERRIGSYANLSADWSSFQEKYRAYITDKTVFLERTYDDPSITDTDECLYDICLSAPEGCALPNTDTIRGGKFAVYHFKGKPAGIYAAYQSIWTVWLPQSRRKLDGRYGFEAYRKIDCDTMYMEIDLCIPVQ